MGSDENSNLEDRNPTQVLWLRICAFLGFSGVAFGAMGAHAIRALGADRLEWWNTGAKYHLFHAFAVGLTALVGPRRIHLIAGLFLAGIVLFSGSLYALALTGQRMLGRVTPLGGLCFLIGWGVLGFFPRRAK